MLKNGDKLKVGGIESVRIKLHKDAIQTFHNVRYVPCVVVNIISMRDDVRAIQLFWDQSRDARCTQRFMMVQEWKNEKKKSI